jgi:hypothetical protein
VAHRAAVKMVTAYPAGQPRRSALAVQPTSDDDVIWAEPVTSMIWSADSTRPPGWAIAAMTRQSAQAIRASSYCQAIPAGPRSAAEELI